MPRARAQGEALPIGGSKEESWHRGWTVLPPLVVRNGPVDDGTHPSPKYHVATSPLKAHGGEGVRESKNDTKDMGAPLQAPRLQMDMMGSSTMLR